MMVLCEYSFYDQTEDWKIEKTITKDFKVVEVKSSNEILTALGERIVADRCKLRSSSPDQAREIVSRINLISFLPACGSPFFNERRKW